MSYEFCLVIQKRDGSWEQDRMNPHNTREAALDRWETVKLTGLALKGRIAKFHIIRDCESITEVS